MDDLEFRRKAIIEPDSSDVNFLHKKHQNKHNSRFVDEQKTFQQSLLDTLNIATPDNLSERIILSQQLSQHKHQQKKKHRQQLRNWFIGSTAASLLIALSIYLFTPATMDSSQLAQNVISHVHNDTHALDVRMDVPKSSIDTMLASYGGRLNGPIGKVSFLGRCIVGSATGIHLVLNTPQGLVTVILLPSQAISQPSTLADSHYHGILYPSEKGSIAIIAEQQNLVTYTRERIDRNLNWLI